MAFCVTEIVMVCSHNEDEVELRDIVFMTTSHH